MGVGEEITDPIIIIMITMIMTTMATIITGMVTDTDTGMEG
jgi:hypothetical protein